MDKENKGKKEKKEIEQYLDAKDNLESIKAEYKELKKKSRKLIKIRMLNFIAILWIVLGIAFLFIGGFFSIRDKNYSEKIQAMPIIATNYEEEYLKKFVLFSYVYVYNNDAYSNRVVITKKEIHKMIETEAIMVRVNPKHPDRSYIDRDTQFISVVYTIGGVFILIGILSKYVFNKKEKDYVEANTISEDISSI